MHRHTRAVILLGGWLLMLPPLAKEQQTPLAQWEHYRAYDTARECENATDPEIELLTKTVDKMVDRHLKEPEATLSESELRSLDLDNVMIARWIGRRCVPAEAVYPPQAPAQK